MKNRNFDEWLDTLTDSIATWNYYTDFKKVYKKVDDIKIALNILNTLIGSKNIRNDFLILLDKYPETLKCIPILIAKREMEIIIKDLEKDYYFNFKEKNYSNEEYCNFMENTGLFDLIENRIVNNLYDYVTGIEVGLDSNARKNRTGHTMEDIVEKYIQKAGYIKDATYFKEMNKSEIEKKWGIDLSAISNGGKTEKRFDFVIKTEQSIYGVEVNFYSSSGSKLNEIARSYKNIANEAEEITGFKFVWVTDGVGWINARNNLRETFEVLDDIYNLNDLKQNAIPNNII